MTTNEFVSMVLKKKLRVKALEDDRKAAKKKYIDPIDEEHAQEQSRLRSFLLSGIEAGEVEVGKVYVVGDYSVTVVKGENTKAAEANTYYVVHVHEVTIL